MLPTNISLPIDVITGGYHTKSVIYVAHSKQTKKPGKSLTSYTFERAKWSIAVELYRNWMEMLIATAIEIISTNRNHVQWSNGSNMQVNKYRVNSQR